MAKYLIEVPRAVLAAMKDDLGDDGEKLTGKAVVVAWMRRQALPGLRRGQRRTLGDPTGLEAARDALQAQPDQEVADRKLAEISADAQAETDAASIA